MKQTEMTAIDIIEMLDEQYYNIGALPFKHELHKMYMNIRHMASQMSRLEVDYRQTRRKSVLEKIQVAREEIFAAKKRLEKYIFMAKLMA